MSDKLPKKFKSVNPKSKLPPQRDDKVFYGQRFMVWALNVLANAKSEYDAASQTARNGSAGMWLKQALDMIRAYIMDRLCTSFPFRDFYMPTDEEIFELLKMDDHERRCWSACHHFFIRLAVMERNPPPEERP